MGGPDKPRDVIDRAREWAALTAAWTRARPELLFVTGRRRVGKSHLLSRFAVAVGGLYYQATRRAEGDQIASLGAALGRHFGDEAAARGAVFTRWEALFDYLTEHLRRRGDALLLVIDEFPYLTAVAPALTSILQRFWDHEWAGSRLRLVLSGSHISAMRALEERDQPLFGRRTGRLLLGPFRARDAAEMVPTWSTRDQMLLFGTLGSLPGHLALVDETRSLAENLAELALTPGGRLVDEAQHLLDGFAVEADVHYALLEAIATGDRTWSRLTSRVGKTGGSLLRPLRWLEEMGLIARRVPITEARPERSRRVTYAVCDPYLRFWHRHIAPLVRAGSVGLADPGHLYAATIAPGLDDTMGAVFEEICREHVAWGGGPWPAVRLGAWWDAHGTEEVDVAAVSAEGRLFAAECKWGPVRLRDLESLRRRAGRVAGELGGVSGVDLGLFSGRGEFDAAVREAAARGEVRLFGPEELVGRRPPGGAHA